MDQNQQPVKKPEDLVRKLKPWWGVAIAGLLSAGVMGGIIAIHYAGQIAPAKKSVSYQKADGSWIDHEPDRVAHAEASVARVASPTPTPTPQAAATAIPQYQPPAQSYIPPSMPNAAADHRRQEYEKALASDLLVAPRGQGQVLETPRLVSAGGVSLEGQDSGAAQSSGPIIADAHPASFYTITTGTVIYGTLETGINSDIPGDVLGRVAQDVKDSISERYVLIPQGSKLIGSYSNQLIPSQQRLMVKWSRIVFPNGGELNLPDLTGTDAAGYAGFQDQVNHHYAKVWAPALLMSAISAGMMMSDYPMMSGGPYGAGGYYMSPGQMAAMGAGQQLGQEAMGRMANVQVAPTIQIRPGYHFRVLVTRDLVFSGPYQDNGGAQQ
ncbi:MAG TPA: TrbI/VirB10 family protein [Candidatus Binataceae bacterium]|nr:TrbI/VirB10 family protein [Candidatus Binataceae bacterium]